MATRRSSSKRRSPGASKSRRIASREIRTEMHHMRSGKHAAKHPIKSRKQAIAIGLNKARKKGARIPKPSAKQSKR